MIYFSSPPPPSLFSLLYVQVPQPSLGNAADWGTKAAAVRILRASALVTKWPAYCTLLKKQIPYRYDMKCFLTCLLLGKVDRVEKQRNQITNVVGRWTQRTETMGNDQPLFLPVSDGMQFSRFPFQLDLREDGLYRPG